MWINFLIGLYTIGFFAIVGQVIETYIFAYVWNASFFSLQAPQYFPYKTITSFLDIVAAWNSGVGFSAFSESFSPLFFVLIACTLCLFFCYLLYKTELFSLLFFAYSLIVGGAIGNLIDRIRIGFVFDFLDFHWGAWHFPVFNIADIFISVGGLLFFISAFSVSKKATD